MEFWKVSFNVASAIAILTFQTTSDFDFALYNVKDFYGGFLLGLFGNIVASSVYNRIYSKSPSILPNNGNKATKK
jgi:hypothetical protein